MKTYVEFRNSMPNGYESHSCWIEFPENDGVHKAFTEAISQGIQILAHCEVCESDFEVRLISGHAQWVQLMHTNSTRVARGQYRFDDDEAMRRQLDGGITYKTINIDGKFFEVKAKRILAATVFDNIGDFSDVS